MNIQILTISILGLGHSDTGVCRQVSLYAHVFEHQVQLYLALRVLHNEQSGCSL